MQYAVETNSLTKIFSDWWGRDKVYAVDNLNLKIKYNEVFGLLGPNGSGKTTTLKMLLGLLYPTKGRAFLLGGNGSDPKINARIGFLPEESYLYRYLNARETLDFYGRLFGLPGKVRKMRIEALLDMVGLKAVAGRSVGTFSKGMARRIGLAQALINDPDLLILDEPTTGLDPIGTRQIKDLILKLAERGKTILLCSHLLADVEDVCDRIAILYGGRIQTEGRVKELLQQTGKRQITAGAISDDTLAKIKQMVEQEDSDCEITCPMDKLETFFVRTVAAAQQKAQPTAGAVSTTRIGDFLTMQSSVENVLDKLVSAPVSQQQSTTEETKKIAPEKATESMPDEQLLRDLIKAPEPSKPVPVSGPESSGAGQSRPETFEQERQQDILDQLTGRTKHPGEDSDRTGQDKSQAGESGDA